ncbi:lysozyme 2-like [Tetranychus urticae]|uniref:lysozyme n=1 Tax=Tetranychus urticae TaxID=32264 RepID=T1JTZ8_TETUR|nr:lysozyme 2-like [Tetranychus urticae]XP_015789682.1 lysozyme 2-like [Tetranychus urticae]
MFPSCFNLSQLRSTMIKQQSTFFIHAIIAMIFWFHVSIGDPHALDDDCLKCICSASSECDDQVRCHTEGQDDYFCGPFQVSRNYWFEAGSPGYDASNPMDFENCVNNIYCAIQTVNQYLKIKQKDCDADGIITCQDYALLHKFGPANCTDEKMYSNSSFWHKFDSCFSFTNGTKQF